MNEMIQKIVTTLYDKKAQDIVALDVSGMTVITDCMVIASGRSALQVKTLADEVEDRLSEGGVYPLRKEGQQAGGWCWITARCSCTSFIRKSANFTAWTSSGRLTTTVSPCPLRSRKRADSAFRQAFSACSCAVHLQGLP